MATVQLGGCFAPTLTIGQLADYKELAEKAPPHVRDAMLILCNAVEEFNKTPDSKLPAQPHISGLQIVTPLEKEEIKRMDPHIPWKHELDSFSVVFEELDPTTQTDTRNAAFHLLWYGYELFMDREPITVERVKHLLPS